MLGNFLKLTKWGDNMEYQKTKLVQCYINEEDLIDISAFGNLTKINNKAIGISGCIRHAVRDFVKNYIVEKKPLTLMPKDPGCIGKNKLK